MPPEPAFQELFTTEKCDIGLAFTAKLLLFLIIPLFFSSPLAVGAEEAPKAETATIQLRWHHQFQFAGYYAAIEKGFYADEGLQVSLREYEPGKDRIAPVLDGRAQYGVGDPSLLVLRAQGEPVVVLAQIFQHSPSVLITLSESDILRADELIGKKVMLSVDDIGDVSIQAMILEVLGDMDQVITVPRADGHNALLDGQVEAMAGYLSNQPFKLKRKGVEVNLIDPRSYGIDSYGDNLFTSEQEIKTNPERAEKLRRATLKGWAYALDNKAEMIDLIIEKYNPGLDREQLRYEAKIIDQMMVPDLVPIGDMDARRYEHIAQTYQRLGLIRTSSVPDGFIYQDEAKSSSFLTAEEQEWLDAHPDIVLGSDPGFKPFVFQDESGSVLGVEADLINLINKLTGANIRITLGNWPDIVQKGRNREIDGLLTSIRTKEREPYFLFSDTYRNQYLYVFSHERHFSEFKTMEDLVGKRVGLPRRMRSFEQVLKTTPGIIPVYTDSLDESYRLLIDDEIDAIIGANSIQSMLSENLIPDYGVAFVVPDSNANVVYSIRKDWPELVSIINKSIAAIAEKERLAIFDKWGGNHLGPSSDFVSGLTPEEQAWLKAHPDITLGFSDQYEPFLIKGEDGSLSGILIDYLNQMNAKLGTQFKPEGGPWAEILTKVERKELDGTLTMTAAAANARGLLKTNAQFQIYPAVFVREGAPFRINSLDDLRGKSVAIIDPSHFSEKLLEPLGEEVDIKRIANPVELMRMVYEGKVDIALTITAHNYIAARFGLTGIRPAYILWDRPIASLMGVRPDWPELKTILNKGIASFSRDEINALLVKWINIPGERSNSVEFTDAEKAWLAKKHTVRVRVVDFPPYTILQGVEFPEGIAIDYLKEISERSGIRFDYEVTTQPFAEFLGSMKGGTGPDLTTTLVRSPAREEFLSFSDGYLESPLVIFARSDADFISDINGLTGKRVGIIDGTEVHRRMTDGYPEIGKVVFDSAELGLEALATGQVDAYIGNLTASSHIIHRRGFADLHVVAPTPFEKYVFSMANRRDWPELTSIINKVFRDISAEEHSAIQGKYTQLPYEQGFSTDQVAKWALTIVVPALLIILVFLYLNRSMAKEVHNRKLAEEAAKRAQNAAEAATLAKSAFLANMSHELRTPMSTILGFARLLSRDKTLGPEQREKVGIIDRSGEHLLGMVDEILSLAKIEAGRVELVPESFNLVRMLKDVGLMIKSRAETKDLRFDLQLDANLSNSVRGDAGKIRQILINLLGNAVKFTSKGSVWLRARSQAMADAPARVKLCLEVGDTGPGIAQEQLDAIFDSFTQGDSAAESSEGVGLGLAISKALVDVMGGEIDVKSEQGKGSLFTVTIPLEFADTSVRVREQPREARVIGLRSGQPDWRILVVDDNRDNRALLTGMLGQVGFVSREAENGNTAIEVFQEWHPHLIWMDIRMPVMDGCVATKKIRELPMGEKVKIIAVTAHAFEEHRREFLAAGCDDMVHKPFREHEIFDAMARQLGVEYLYGDMTEPSAAEETVTLTAEMLSELPIDILDDLRESTLRLNREAVLGVIERIEPGAPDTARGLRALTVNLKMGRILDLLRAAPRTENTTSR